MKQSKGMRIAACMLALVLFALPLSVQAAGITKAPSQTTASQLAAYAPIFQASFYRQKYSDVNRVYGNDDKMLLRHFLSYGMKEGRQGSEEFNVDIYRERYADLEEAFGEDLPAYYFHYLNYGKAEGRSARADETAPTEEMVFYDHAVFIGDSILNDFRSYVQTTGRSVAGGSEFLTMDTFSLTHSLKSIDDDTVQPTYQGVKRNVWDQLPYMDVDKVFLMFGVNDLRKNYYPVVYQNALALVAKIKQTNPGLQIYVIGMTPVIEGQTKGYLNKNTILLYNELLRTGASAGGYTYVDLFNPVADEENNLPKDYCRDGYIHNNYRCFVDIWEKILTSFAREQIAAGK